MKVAYKGIVFFILAVAITSCFDPPEFPTTPEIEFESIYFGETPGISDPDSIVIAINFKDGDGNVGLNKITTTTGDAIDNVNDPYHSSNFYLSDGGTSLKEIGTETFYTDTFQNGIQEFVPIKILTTRNQSGKLVTFSNQAGYSALPPLEKSKTGGCLLNYTREKIFVFKDDWAILDSRYQLKDTLRDAFGNLFLSTRDSLYTQPNPNHYSIEVDFLIKQPSHPDAGADGYREYDWRKEFCTTFDGRFSQLSDTETPLEGTIRYAMKSVGFSTFGAFTLKLRISIKDRDLNVSNIIYTPEFTLDKIRAK